MVEHIFTTILDTTFTGIAKALPQEYKGEKSYGFGRHLSRAFGIFSIDYAVEYMDKLLIQFSIILSDKEAIELEEILKRERLTRKMKSETYYNGSIYLTCMIGDKPVISFSEKGISISLAKNEDYAKLEKELTSFLDNKKLEPELEELRNQW